ncbi:LOW QUALITY PROTEIN: hypothetical protein GQ55_8G228700 [Panicum hallii var. hallii]|uniref:KIB1-4 beta-propeller domain-containing protein n=1 Tax=Panicum hallii var. hallii TaxID=1504633 RepID=A0A2T7CQ93_9POAL|nr:LOW QUALITY PROTEIN: hypothetical protein GQ55_8G228700 [Panicum hallii var. hallii]
MGAWLCKASPVSSPGGWSALPPELSNLVLRRLPSLADRVRFASPCRHVLAPRTTRCPSLPRALPWLNFRDGSFRSLPDGELHSFRFREPEDTLCELGYCRPRLRYYLKKPLGRATKRLPGYCREPVHLNRVGSHGRRSSSRSTDFRIRKVIICSKDLVVAKANYPHRPCAVVCCRPGMLSSWSTGLCNGFWYQDMAFYEGKLYTVTIEGDLFADEVSTGTGTEEEEPTVSRMERVIQATQPNCATRCYLVISCTGKLLMVESLGDEVLFVSSSCSRASAASSHGGYLQGNRIYFLDDSLVFWFFGRPSNRPACGVFDMSSSTIHPIPLGQQWHLSMQSKASWFFP